MSFLHIPTIFAPLFSYFLRSLTVFARLLSSRLYCLRSTIFFTSLLFSLGYFLHISTAFTSLLSSVLYFLHVSAFFSSLSSHYLFASNPECHLVFSLLDFLHFFTFFISLLSSHLYCLNFATFFAALLYSQLDCLRFRSVFLPLSAAALALGRLSPFANPMQASGASGSGWPPSLGRRTIAQHFAPDFDRECCPFPFVLSTRAGAEALVRYLRLATTSYNPLLVRRATSPERPCYKPCALARPYLLPASSTRPPPPAHGLARTSLHTKAANKETGWSLPHSDSGWMRPSERFMPPSMTR